MACEAGQPLFKELLAEYDTAHFLLPDGSLDTTTNVTRITNTCLKYGLVLNNTKQTVGGFTLFPKDFFCPKDSETKRLDITDNTYTIHHFDGSWQSPEQHWFNEARQRYRKVMPYKLASYLATVIAAVKFRGFKGLLHPTKRG